MLGRRKANIAKIMDNVEPEINIFGSATLLFFKSSWWKIASAARNCINSVP